METRVSLGKSTNLPAVLGGSYWWINVWWAL